MSSPSKIESLFFAALEKATAEERAVFLDSACGTDIDLRRQVEKLLKAHPQVGDFLQQPALAQLGATPSSLDVAQMLNAATDPDTAETMLHNTPASPQTEGAEESEDPLLEFLTPSTKPESLGRIGHYEVLEVLGSGGFGIVLRAFDEKLHRVVAVKVLSPLLAVTSPARKRFLREARSSAKIRHQNIVQVYAVEEQPLPYLVMEYIPGETLQQRIDRTGPLELDEVVQLGRQIAEGLAAAHAQGLIHRDIKPANILIEAGAIPCVKITDFGLARAADDASLTHSGTIAGTPMFMAPEQAQADTIDHRADLFSFGSVLYTMCSGRPPFRAPNTLAVLKRVAEETARPIQEIIPETPQWLCDIITRLHAKKPGDRIASAQEVADLLARGSAANSCLTATPSACAASDVDDENAHADGVDDAHADGVAVKHATVFLPSARDLANDPTVVLEPVPTLNSTSRTRRWAFAASMLLLCVAGLGFAEGTGVTNLRGTVIRLFSPEGTLVVEVDDPGVSVQIDGSDIVITGAGAKEIRVKPGKHMVEARKNGQLVKRELATVTKNGRQVVRIIQEPPVAEIAANENQDPNRRAAEYVLSIGGWVEVNDRSDQIKAATDLPTEPFQLTTANLMTNTQVNDAALARFKDCKSLKAIALNDTQVGDVGLVHLKGCPKLQYLALYRTKATGKGLGELKTALPNLQIDSDVAVNEPSIDQPDRRAAEYALSIGGAVRVNEQAEFIEALANLPPGPLRLKTVHLISHPQLTDADLAHFKNCKNLTEVRLSGASQVGDAGMAYFKDCRNLVGIGLENTRVGDAGLVHFANLKNLRLLGLSDTPVSDEGLAHFQVCKDLAFLALNGTQISDAGLAHFKDCKNLMKLDLANTKVSDAGVAHFKDCKSLTILLLSGTQVTDAGLACFQDCKTLTHLHLAEMKVGDAGLAHLKGCQNLETIELRRTSVSDEGLVLLKDLKKLKSLNLRETQVTALGIADLKQALPDCKIEWEPQVALWPADAPLPAIAPFDAEQAKQHQQAWAKYLGVPIEYTDSIGMKFMLIPPGIFQMGSPLDETGRHGIYDESQYRVTLTKAFYLGTYEVTQAEWQSVTGKNPSKFKAEPRLPVEQVSWNDCLQFAKTLRDKTQKMYRLPSEAEWEYACRAGTTTPFHFGDMISTDQANLTANKGGREDTSDVDRRKPMRVGSFPPNAYGLFDMHGNVYEFCADSLEAYAKHDPIDPVGPEHEHGRVMRGGSFKHLPSTCRSASRETLTLDRGFQDIGVRLALSVDSVKTAIAKENSPSAKANRE